MGLQGNKATHDFLSLYTAAKDSPLHLHDSKPPPPPAQPPPPLPSQGLFLRTHDFLQPLEKEGSPAAAAAAGSAADKELHVLPGGIGTFSISHVADADADARAAAAAVKAEPPFALWGHPAVAEAAGAKGHWSLPFAARGGGGSGSGGGAGHVTTYRQQQQQKQPAERKGGGFMDSGSRSSRGGGEGAGFEDEDLDADEFAARREVSSSLKELTVRVDGMGGSCSGSGTDQRPNTPRSKHSATEQRRRSKINDRFQILRELLPHSDQKRDKASFLLEVIEYIRFLQEKVQKYEVSYPEWNQENAKIMPWSNLFFRSFWKNAQNKGQIPGDALPDPSQVVKNGSSPRFVFPGKFDDNHNAVASAAASGAPDQAETDALASASYRSGETLPNVPNNVSSQPEVQWASMPSADDHVVNREMLNDPELTIDEGTISLSSQYSQELLTTLSRALQSSGIDLSQASISVQINLGKRAVKRPASGATSSSKEFKDPPSNNQAGHHLRLGDGAEELLHAQKRHKSARS